ncbi:MAG: Asp-tRNA(Asn)/Glu-tRNA(Gln) amidotransferase subunit GatC [Pseudomonadota bacterium]
MQISQATVLRVAKLARIKIEPDHAASLEGELTAILDWVDQLSELDTSDVPPMSGVALDSGVGSATPLRSDTVAAGTNPDAVLVNAPERHDNFFAVPKVVE